MSLKLYTDHLVIVTVDGREYSVTNGATEWPSIQGINLNAGGTNVGTLRGGYGYALVDATGKIQDWTVSEVDLALMVIQGFGFALAILGIPMAVLWTVRRVLKAGSVVPTSSID